MRRTPHHAMIPLLLLLVATGCGTTLYQPGRAARFELDAQIDDEEIRAAFAATPRMQTPARVAFYSLDPDAADDIERMLERVPGVAETYRVPHLLVTGRRRFDAAPVEPAPTSVRQLRLLAARARCDLLVVFDHGYRIARRPNALAALNVLVLPALFVPFMDAEIDSYMDAHVIDTRSGYLHGQLGSEQTGRRERLRAFSDADRRLADEHFATLLEDTRRTLARILAEPAAEAGASDG